MKPQGLAKTQNRPVLPFVIAAAKAEENQDSIILIKDDHDAQKFMAAWRLQKTSFIDRPLKQNELVSEALDSVWETCGFDIAKIADIAKLPLSAAVRELKRLKDARLIYPDGSLHKMAVAVLSREVQAYLKSLLYA